MMDPVVGVLQEHGYTNVNVERRGGVYKVEAEIRGQKREIVYDAKTGHILSDRIDTDGDGRMDQVVHDYKEDDREDGKGRRGDHNDNGDSGDGEGEDEGEGESDGEGEGDD